MALQNPTGRTLGSQNANNVAITGGTINGIATATFGTGNKTVKIDPTNDGTSVQLELRNSEVGGLVYIDFAPEVTGTTTPDYTSRLYCSPTEFVIALQNNVNFSVPNGQFLLNGLGVTFNGAVQQVQ
jgi:hypothetical protein